MLDIYTDRGEGRDDASAAQTEWQRFADDVRDALRGKLEHVPQMSGQELEKFVAACRDALWLSVNAASWDKELDLQQTRQHFS